MAQNPLLNDLIEERFFPIVTSIRGFFGFNEQQQQQQLVQPHQPQQSSRPLSAHYPSSSSSSAGQSNSNHARSCSPSQALVSPSRSRDWLSLNSVPKTQYNGSATSTQARTCSPAGSNGNFPQQQQQQNPFSGGLYSDLGRSSKDTPQRNPVTAAKLDSRVSTSAPNTPRSKQTYNSEQSRDRDVTGGRRSPYQQTIADQQSAGGGDHVMQPTNNGSSLKTTGDELTVNMFSMDANLDEPDYASVSNSEKLGRIQFSVSYDFDAQTLTIKIIKAESLAAKDLSGTSDPYVKISLLPDKKHTLTTNIKRKNLNPRWNEVFAFEGFPYNKVVTKTLYLLVLDYDRFSRDDPIGEVCLPLGDLDLAAGLTMWKTLMPCKGSAGKLGVLLLSLCYQPTVGCITIAIIKARDLKAKDINGLSDPYVKIWLTFEGKKMEKKKTEIKEKTLNPNFNETFTFTVPYERIRQTSLVVSVMDYDRMGRNEAIGQIVLGPKSGPMEIKHWNEMFAKSRTAVAQWHILKDFD